jgi:hypothetical protein
MDGLFPELPQDLGGVGDAEIQEILAAHMAAIEKIAAGDEEFLGALDAETILEQMAAGVEDVERIKAEITSRVEGAEAFKTRAAELAAKAGIELAPEPLEIVEELAEETAEATLAAEAEEEPEPAEEPEPVLAAAPPRARRPLPKPSAAHEPMLAEHELAFTASADVPGFRTGQRLETKLDIATALLRARDSVTQTPAGFRQDAVVASLNWGDSYPEERRLLPKSDDANGFPTWDKIANVVRPNGTLVAAGGVCAPVTPYYGQQFIATLDRPVRDALVAFNADRGGIRYNPPIGIGTITGSDAVGIITEAEDAEGGTFAAKSCLTVACVSAQEVDVDIIYHCVTWSNLTARTFPERVAQFNDTVMAGWARLAETNLLDGIKAASTNVTQANTNLMGATSSLLGSVLTAAAGQRSRQRMPADATLRALLPAWSRDLLVADIVRSQFQRFDMSEAGLVALLRSYNVEPSFYLDGPSTGTGQVFGAQAGGALDTFPSVVQWALFPEGSFLFLDGGVLELGIVRDSVLNAENQFQIFGESFENVAFVGIESLWITTTVCPSGTVAAPIDNTDFCGG